MPGPASCLAALDERLDSLEGQMQRRQTHHQQEIQGLRQLVIHRPSGANGPASGGSGACTDDTAG